MTMDSTVQYATGTVVSNNSDMVPILIGLLLLALLLIGVVYRNYRKKKEESRDFRETAGTAGTASHTAGATGHTTSSGDYGFTADTSSTADHESKAPTSASSRGGADRKAEAEKSSVKYGRGFQQGSAPEKEKPLKEAEELYHYDRDGSKKVICTCCGLENDPGSQQCELCGENISVRE